MSNYKVFLVSLLITLNQFKQIKVVFLLQTAGVSNQSKELQLWNQ